MKNIILVCGGRDFSDRQKMNDAMHHLSLLGIFPDLIVQGGARGADSLARSWATENMVHSAEVPALWEKFGKAAGHKRNGAMLFLNINYCVAFPGGKGTADMIKKCKSNGIVVWEPYGGSAE